MLCRLGKRWKREAIARSFVYPRNRWFGIYIGVDETAAWIFARTCRVDVEITYVSIGGLTNY